jgi:ribosomal protein S18 acetylase RimI-like enzyme
MNRGSSPSEPCIRDLDASNVDELGFFCNKSRKKARGYQQKLRWLKSRFDEGMKVKILYEGSRSVGFIEYIPAEVAWRAVIAPEHMIIHCLWVVGRSKGKGYGGRLLQACLEDAANRGKAGVAMVTSSRSWLAGKELLKRYGFEVVDRAEPSFELLARSIRDGPRPHFPSDWKACQQACGTGITVFRSDQCPYVDLSVQTILESANQLGIPARVIEMGSASEARSSPSPYGTFGVVYNGELLSYCPIFGNDIEKLLERRAKREDQ